MLKPIFKKTKQETVEPTKKKIMLTDLCPEEKQRIGQMMLIMEKQKSENKELHSQLKQQKQGSVIQGEYLEQTRRQNERLVERIKQVQEKYIQCSRDLEKQREKISKLPIKPIVKSTGVQIQLHKQNVHIQTQQANSSPAQSRLLIQQLGDRQQPFTKLPYRGNNHQLLIPPLPPITNRQDHQTLTFEELEEYSPKEKNEVSASRLAKEWIKTKKQKIDKMKKDIIKSQRKLYKQLQYTPAQSENYEESNIDSESSGNSQKIKSLRQYHQKLKKMKDQFEGEKRVERPRTEESLPFDIGTLRRSKIDKNQQHQPKRDKSNGIDIDNDALNKMLKSKDFKVSEALQCLKIPPPLNPKKSQTKIKSFYGSDLVDLIQTLEN